MIILLVFVTLYHKLICVIFFKTLYHSETDFNLVFQFLNLSANVFSIYIIENPITSVFLS